jgi:hypothetical protein
MKTLMTSDGASHILSIMQTVNEVKDDLREVKSNQERQATRITELGQSMSTMHEDVTAIKEGPMYSVEKYLQRQVIRFGGIGGLLMLLLALTGWSL